MFMHNISNLFDKNDSKFCKTKITYGEIYFSESTV